MEAAYHTLSSLFSQLGLENSPDAVAQFIDQHALGHDMALERAPFWTRSQVQFLLEARMDDSDWCEQVDQLDAMLHRGALH